MGPRGAHSIKPAAPRWHKTCCWSSALPPTHGVCEHVDGRNSGAGRCVGGRTHPPPA